MSYQTNERCIISGISPCEFHHLKTRGAGGLDVEWNMMPLSREKHSEAHHLGLRRFVEKYPQARSWMIKRGWEFDPVLFKWTHP